MGLSPVAATYILDFVSASIKEFLDIQATTECGFALKQVHDIGLKEQHIYYSF